jgi:hypothetical protein
MDISDHKPNSNALASVSRDRAVLRGLSKLPKRSVSNDRWESGAEKGHGQELFSMKTAMIVQYSNSYFVFLT